MDHADSWSTTCPRRWINRDFAEIFGAQGTLTVIMPRQHAPFPPLTDKTSLIYHVGSFESAGGIHPTRFGHSRELCDYSRPACQEEETMDCHKSVSRQMMAFAEGIWGLNQDLKLCPLPDIGDSLPPGALLT